MADRVRRVSDNHPNVQTTLFLAPLAVVYQQSVHQVFVLIHLEGICQADALKRRVFTAFQVMIGCFDVDGSDVVRQQDDLIGVKLLPVLALKLFRFDQA